VSSRILWRSFKEYPLPDLSLPAYQPIESVRQLNLPLVIFQFKYTLVIYHIINRFARTCHLGFDGQPTCDCPPGYVGRRCEQCATGYQGNPLIPGDMCVPLQQCDPNGSLSPNADPHTGKCHCKV